MDVLDDILDTLDLKGVFYFRTDFSAPWGVRVPNFGQAARFHLVVHGDCVVRLETGESLLLHAGDLVLIPHGACHVISDSADTPAAELETTLKSAGYTGEGALVLGDGDPTAATQLICGHFDFRKGADHPLLRALPSHLVTTTAARAQNPWLDESLRLVTQRVFSDTLGAQATVTRLSEIVFIELLRSGVSTDPKLNAVLAGFRDPHVGGALLRMHRQPEERWTVGDLARSVGMSRSRFANRFKEVVGVGPMTYLADWRLQKALALLDESRCTIQQVAHQTGYQSAAAFTRAFVSHFGLPPTEYRRDLG